MKEVLSRSNLKRTLENKELDMKTGNIVHQLLQGSDNLNRMQNEIHRIVSMLIGFSLERPEYYDHTGGLSMDRPLFTWYVTANSETGQITSIECHLPEPGNSAGDMVSRLAYTSSNKKAPYGLTPSNTQRVYESLPELVRGIYRVFPHIEKASKPLTNAAHVKFA